MKRAINIYTDRLQQFGKHLMKVSSPPANYIVPTQFIILRKDEPHVEVDLIYIHNALEQLVNLFDAFYIDDDLELYYNDPEEGILDGEAGAIQHFQLTLDEFSYLFECDGQGTFKAMYGGNVINKSSTYKQIAENILILTAYRNRLEGRL